MAHQPPFHRIPLFFYWAFLFTPALLESLTWSSAVLWICSALLFSPLLYWKTLRWASYTTLILLGFINIIHIGFFGHLADQIFLATALRTNPEEVGEFIHIIPKAWVGGALLWSAVAIGASTRIEKLFRLCSPLSHPSWSKKIIHTAACIWMVFFLFSLAKGYSFEQVARKIKTLYPMHIVRAWVAHQQLSDALFYVPRIPQPDPTKVQADTVVVVIGESASAQRWSLLGYQAADTNAPLRALTGLQTIRVMAHGLNTAAALPYLLTGMDAEDSVAQQAPSFLDLAKHAGYKTFVISNSRYHSSAEDFYGVTLRRSADTYLKAGNGAYDEILTAELETALADPTPRKLIVLHTYGSHFQVEQRYPATHAPFQDPYDNSLHYTSSLLAQWITLLQASAGPQQKVALVYSSDHGVAMPPCADGYHTGSGLSSLQVPLLIWSNDAALTANLPALTSEETLNVRRSNAEFAEFVANSVGYSLHLSPDSKARQLLYQLQPWETVQKLDACTLEPRP